MYAYRDRRQRKRDLQTVDRPHQHGADERPFLQPVDARMAAGVEAIKMLGRVGRQRFKAFSELAELAKQQIKAVMNEAGRVLSRLLS